MTDKFKPNVPRDDHAVSGARPLRIKIGSQRESLSTDPPEPSPDTTIAAQAAEQTANQAAEGRNAPAESAEHKSSAVDSPTTVVPAPTASVQLRTSAEEAARLEAEVEAALGGMSIDELLAVDTGIRVGADLDLDGRYRATVIKVHRDSVFVALPGHHQGVASARHLPAPPDVQSVVEVVVNRFNADEGLYEVSLPGAAADVGDWSDVHEGMVVEAVVTGHNAGGLECEVSGIRAFIPVSQVAVYRVQHLEEFVGQRWACVVAEANPARRNLVLSRRAVLEREREEAKTHLLAALEVGQVRDGIVRNVRDFGAFVDLGGVDGLIPVGKLSWDRVQHPSDVLQEGQRIKVRVDRVDAATGKISLSYRDVLTNPWQGAVAKFPVNAIVEGVVSKLMDFGAFVRLEAGIEGLVHISELAHHRVGRVDSVVKEGQPVTVKILAVDPDAQRISLSMKAVQAARSADAEDAQSAELDEALEATRRRQASQTLRGGTSRRGGGDQFGLKW